MAGKGAFLGHNALLGDGSYVENRPSKLRRTWDILSPYVTKPAMAVKSLMDTPLETLLYNTGPKGRAAAENAFDVAGTFAAGSSVVPKPRNALNMGIRAYHGSPHDFDRFDLSKIGTGEGAQAYGHGLYFAENEGIARSYRDALSDPVNKRIDPNSMNPQDIAIAFYRRLGDKNGAWHAERMAQSDPANADAYREAAKIIRSGDPYANASKGHMYEVEINADPNAFLDWDKPLSEQPEVVRQALGLDKLPGPPTDQEVQAVFALAQERGVNAFEMPEYKALEARLDNYKADAWKQMGIAPPYRGNIHLRADEITGGEYVHGLEKGELGPTGLATSTPNASRILREKGIPGIKYLDAGSRGAGDGTRNYVVFDDKLIEILRKYGMAGLLPAGVGGAALFSQGAPAQAQDNQ